MKKIKCILILGFFAIGFSTQAQIQIINNSTYLYAADFTIGGSTYSISIPPSSSFMVTPPLPLGPYTPIADLVNLRFVDFTCPGSPTQIRTIPYTGNSGYVNCIPSITTFSWTGFPSVLLIN